MDAGATMLDASFGGLPRVVHGASHGCAVSAPADRAEMRVAALLAAAALHAAVLAASSLVFHTRQLPPAPIESGMPVVFQQAAPAEPEALPQMVAAASVPQAASEVPDTLSPLPTVSATLAPAVAPPRVQPQHRTPARATPVVTPRDHTTARQSAPPAPPASRVTTLPQAPPAGDPHALEHALVNWEARIRQAVQDAAIYPQSSRMLHREGSAQIRFDYDRGLVEAVAVAHSSDSGALDTAAMAAVTRAAIPAPPAELGPQKRVMLVWVQFRLVATE